MQVRKIAFVGTRTDRPEDMARFLERVLGLRPDQADWTDFPAILDRRFARR